MYLIRKNIKNATCLLMFVILIIVNFGLFYQVLYTGSYIATLILYYSDCYVVAFRILQLYNYITLCLLAFVYVWRCTPFSF